MYLTELKQPIKWNQIRVQLRRELVVVKEATELASWPDA